MLQLSSLRAPPKSNSSTVWCGNSSSVSVASTPVAPSLYFQNHAEVLMHRTSSGKSKLTQLTYTTKLLYSRTLHGDNTCSQRHQIPTTSYQHMLFCKKLGDHPDGVAGEPTFRITHWYML